MRISRWIKALAGHGHVIAVHNGPREPAFARRFRADPGAVDAIMFQDWGTRDAENGWLAAGIDDQIALSLRDWWGSAVFAEWGYERNPALDLLLPSHQYCDRDHTRHGAWRGAFCGLGIIHGFENSWGPWEILADDQPGLADLLHVLRFFKDVLPFQILKPAPDLVVSPAGQPGHRPLALANAGRERVALYLPVGDAVELALPEGLNYVARWYDPRTGELQVAGLPPAGHPVLAPASPPGLRPLDWVLVLETTWSHWAGSGRLRLSHLRWCRGGQCRQ